MTPAVPLAPGTPVSTHIRRASALPLLLASLAACNGGTTQPPPRNLAVEVEGFLERGGIVHLRVTRQGTEVPAGQWQVSATPADAAQYLGGDSLRLTRSGSITLVVSAGTERGTRAVESSLPPVVYFDRVVDGNRDIWRVDLDGQNLTRLTNDPSSDQDPSIGGGRVVFVSYRGGSADLWSVPTGGGTSTRLTTASRNETTPAISRDGQRLAYAYDGALVSKLWTAGGDGSNAARATEGFGFNGSIESSPSWAPTGNRLAFMSTAAGSADIYQFTPGSGQPSVLAPSDAADVEPAWSPDGDFVAFVSNRSAGNTDVYMVRVSSGAVTRLTSAPQTEGQPAWVDSRRIVYTDFGDNDRRLRWMDVTRPGISHPIDTGPGRAENAAVAP